MKLKLRHAPLAAVALALAALFVPTAAYAAPLDSPTTPDSLCTWSGVEEEAATCTPINYTDWASFVVAPTETAVGQFSLNAEAVGGPLNLGTPTPSLIVPEGNLTTGTTFAVNPSDVSRLPLSISTGVSVNVPGNYEIYGFYGTVVSPDTWVEYGPKSPAINGVLTTPDELVNFPNPYAGLPGTIEQAVPAGTQFGVSYTPVTTSTPNTFAVEIPLATPTFAVHTGETVNAVGYVIALTVQVRDIETGAIFDVAQRQLYSYYSAYSSDLQALTPTLSECEVTGTTICGATGAFSIEVSAYQTVETSQPPVIDPPVVEPPVVEPPVDEPPVVEPPAGEPPAVDTPEHPRVNAGDGFSVLGWFIPVVALLGVGVFLLVNRRGVRA